jgi:hypothetical protein
MWRFKLERTIRKERRLETVNLKDDRVFGFALILLGLVMFGLSFLVATQVRSSTMYNPIPIMGFVAMAVLCLAGVRYVVFSLPRYKDMK